MNQLKIMLTDKSFLRKTLALTIPIALQNMLGNILTLIDNLMIVRLGDASIAAVGLANKVFFVFALLMFGINSGSSILASQYYGMRDLFGIRRVLKISLIIAVGGSFLFVLPGVLFPEAVMRIFTPDTQMIRIGAAFLVVIALSYPLTAVTNCYIAVLRSMNYIKLPVFITSFAIAVNIILNYVLIFGKFGFPKLGVAGSATATLIARLLEVSILLTVVYLHKTGDDGIGDFIHGKFKKEMAERTSFISRSFLSRYFHTAAPVIANEFIWGLGVTMYSLVYGRMGEEATAAMTITGTVEQIAMVFFFGICQAAAVILGNEMGANKLEKAEEYAKNYIVFQLLLSVLVAVLTFFLKDAIIAFFPVSAVVENYIILCLTVFCIYMPIRMVNALFIVAILRSGGDTRATLLIDVSGVWLIGIPMAFLGGLVLHFPIYLVYALIMLEEVYKIILAYGRYRKKKWLKNIVA